MILYTVNIEIFLLYIQIERLIYWSFFSYAWNTHLKWNKVMWIFYNYLFFTTSYIKILSIDYNQIRGRVQLSWNILGYKESYVIRKLILFWDDLPFSIHLIPKKNPEDRNSSLYKNFYKNFTYKIFSHSHYFVINRRVSQLIISNNFIYKYQHLLIVFNLSITMYMML